MNYFSVTAGIDQDEWTCTVSYWSNGNAVEVLIVLGSDSTGECRNRLIRNKWLLTIVLLV